MKIVKTIAEVRAQVKEQPTILCPQIFRQHLWEAVFLHDLPDDQKCSDTQAAAS